MKTNFIYTQVWDKYLPIIRILLKRSNAGEQTLDMNSIDFEKAAAGRRDSYKFNIHIKRGRADNVITSLVAKDLVSTLQKDDTIKQLFMKHEYEVDMNKNFQLMIRLLPEVAVGQDEITAD
ncbi:MAG TPA: hypothetical protein VNR87_02760 [Flavisolibacter sp.]|nr:hypothetical protein [Flavisolibacter sp.]